MSKLFPTKAFAIMAMLTTSPASSETTECIEITTIPAVITVQGAYCLKQNLGTAMTGGYAIEIQTNNVTIDFNGFKLGGLAAGPGSSAIGIYAENRQNITLRNGNIRGFYYGIYLNQAGGTSSGHLIEDNLLDGNIFAGIFVRGSEIEIRRNRVVNTDSTPPAAPGRQPLASGFGKASPGPGSPDILSDGAGNEAQAGTGASAVGILAAQVSNLRIADNTVSRTISSGALAYGISVEGGVARAEVADNTVLETMGHTFTRAIRAVGVANVVVRDNTLVHGRSNSSDAIGIEGGLCLNNTVTDFTDNQAVCTAESGTFP